MRLKNIAQKSIRELNVEQMIQSGCPNISEDIELLDNHNKPAVSGGFHSVYIGKLKGSGVLVAIKYLHDQQWESFINEIRATSHVQHPRILPFLGLVDQRLTDDIALVHPWTKNGNLRTYLRRNANADRCQLCVQVAEGVAYLHSVGIIHGDIRCRNVLISDDGAAKLTGFGSAVLETDTPDPHRDFLFASRSAAPERMLDDVRSQSSSLQYTPHRASSQYIAGWPTTKSDVWSLALAILEAMTEKNPFPGMSELRVMGAVVEERRIPLRPDCFISVKTGYDDILWSLLSSCWAYEPLARPSASAVRDILSIIQREGQYGRPLGNEVTSAIIGHTTSLHGVIESLVAHGCPDISRHISTIDEGSRHNGRSSDVYRGTLFNGTMVAVKSLRSLSNSETRSDKLIKHTAHELYTWSISSHPNVLQLLGLTVFRDRLAMISPWMQYGSLLSYIHINPTINRLDLCLQIAEGLVYMHGLGITHGDIKGDNVVVSDAGVVKITDFGCATMKRDFPMSFTVTESLNYSVRWAAPELFLEDGLSSFETDVYAFAMTVLEAITGDVPHRDRTDRVVIHAVLVKRALPTRPLECMPIDSREANELWYMLERCWSYEPGERPEIRELRDFLKTTAQGVLQTSFVKANV